MSIQLLYKTLTENDGFNALFREILPVLKQNHRPKPDTAPECAPKALHKARRLTALRFYERTYIAYYACQSGWNRGMRFEHFIPVVGMKCFFYSRI